MAIGPLARLLAQVVVPLIAVMARAIPAAYAQALNNAKKSGTATADNVLRKTIARQEALQILNLSETEATAEAVERQYAKYMAANEVNKGAGSFYLQSKVFRARESLAEFQAEKRREEQMSATNSSSKSHDDQ